VQSYQQFILYEINTHLQNVHTPFAVCYSLKDKPGKATTLNHWIVTGGLPCPLHLKVTSLPLTANGVITLSVSTGASGNSPTHQTASYKIDSSSTSQGHQK